MSTMHDRLVQDYPQQFAVIRGPCECGPGWEKLIRRVCDAMKAAGGGQWQCIKEKFGALRMYAQSLDHMTPDAAMALRRAVADAESASLFVCEDCGAPGCCRSRGGWLTTLCDEHARPQESK